MSGHEIEARYEPALGLRHAAAHNPADMLAQAHAIAAGIPDNRPLSVIETFGTCEPVH